MTMVWPLSTPHQLGSRHFGWIGLPLSRYLPNAIPFFSALDSSLISTTPHDFCNVSFSEGYLFLCVDSTGCIRYGLESNTSVTCLHVHSARSRTLSHFQRRFNPSSYPHLCHPLTILPRIHPINKLPNAPRPLIAPWASPPLAPIPSCLRIQLSSFSLLVPPG